MYEILKILRKAFTGIGLYLPFIPRFVGKAFGKMAEATYKYWKGSQDLVGEISDDFMKEATNEEPRLHEYDTYVYWACYCLASFLYLVGWLFQAWLTVDMFRQLMSVLL